MIDTSFGTCFFASPVHLYTKPNSLRHNLNFSDKAICIYYYRPVLLVNMGDFFRFISIIHPFLLCDSVFSFFLKIIRAM